MIGADYSVFASLNAYTFPKSAMVFAKEHDLVVGHVDGAWARVALSGQHLSQFLAFGADTECDLPDLCAKVKLDGWYVINDEEF